MRGNTLKINISKFKKSINESNFTDEQIKIIWDFYVTKSIADTASQKRTVQDYGINRLPLKEMMKVAGISDNRLKILAATSINNTLSEFELNTKDKVDIDNTGIVCITQFTIEDEKAPKKIHGDCESILRHIRNSFAHGNTYFFNNGNLLLEDKKGSKITASILIEQQTLIDWIRLIDIDEKYYSFYEMEKEQCQK